LYYVGRYIEAEPYLLQALPLYETLHGPNDPETVRVLERIALNYEHCPEIGKDPEPYFQKAALALKPDVEHKYEYLANLCRWAECVAKRDRSQHRASWEPWCRGPRLRQLRMPVLPQAWKFNRNWTEI